MSTTGRSWRTPTLHAFAVLQLLFLAAFAQLSFPSSYIKIPDADLTLYFHFNEENRTILMGLELPQKADYFSVGWADEGNYGMIGFDCVAFVFVPNPENNTYTVNTLDLYCDRNGRPPTDASLGGTNDYKLIDSYVTDKMTQVLFERAWDTKDKYDYILDPEKTKLSVVMDWAWINKGKHTFSYHSKTCGTVITKMFNGFQGEAQPYFPGFLSPRLVLIIHGYVMLFGWGILAEIALEVGRYKKFSKNYAGVHLWLMTFLYVLTLISVAFALYVRWGQISGTASIFHNYLSWVLVFLLTIQVTFGSMLGLKMTGKRQTIAIPFLTKFHMIIGILIYILTKIQLANGLYLFNRGYLKYLYAFYGLTFIFRCYQEYSYRYRNRIVQKKLEEMKQEESKTESHQKLLGLLNNNTPVIDILSDSELRSLRWAILDNKVFEMKDFTHPGGNFILNQIQGKEIGRYIYGNYGLVIPFEATQHTHSSDTLKIIEKNFIGTIKSNHQLFLSNSPIQTTDDSSLSGSIFDQNVNGSVTPVAAISSNREKLLPTEDTKVSWVLENKISITSYTTQFEFKGSNCLINPHYEDIKQIGRHLKISHPKQPKIRLYTLVLCQTETRIKRRKELWDQFQNKPTSSIDSMAKSPSFTLPLVVKNYDVPNTATFSKFLHDVPIGTEGFSIEGPYGPGLELSQESSGLHYIFAAGTGILPFLDLFDFLLEDTLDESNNKKRLFENRFRLHIFVSVAQINDFVGLEICEKLLLVCKTRGMQDAFKLTVKAKDIQADNEFEVTNLMFDNVFLAKHVNTHCEKVFICGPPKFNSLISTTLDSLGLPHNKTILV